MAFKVNLNNPERWNDSQGELLKTQKLSINAVARDSNGNIYVGGNFDTCGDSNNYITTKGIARYTPANKWERLGQTNSGYTSGYYVENSNSSSNGYFSSVNNIVIDKYNNVIVTGYFNQITNGIGYVNNSETIAIYNQQNNTWIGLNTTGFITNGTFPEHYWDTISYDFTKQKLYARVSAMSNALSYLAEYDCSSVTPVLSHSINNHDAPPPQMGLIHVNTQIGAYIYFPTYILNYIVDLDGNFYVIGNLIFNNIGTASSIDLAYTSNTNTQHNSLFIQKYNTIARQFTDVINVVMNSHSFYNTILDLMPLCTYYDTKNKIILIGTINGKIMIVNPTNPSNLITVLTVINSNININSIYFDASTNNLYYCGNGLLQSVKLTINGSNFNIGANTDYLLKPGVFFTKKSFTHVGYLNNKLFIAGDIAGYNTSTPAITIQSLAWLDLSTLAVGIYIYDKLPTGVVPTTIMGYMSTSETSVSNMKASTNSVIGWFDKNFSQDPQKSIPLDQTPLAKKYLLKNLDTFDTTPGSVLKSTIVSISNPISSGKIITNPSYLESDYIEAHIPSLITDLEGNPINNYDYIKPNTTVHLVTKPSDSNPDIAYINITNPTDSANIISMSINTNTQQVTTNGKTYNSNEQIIYNGLVITPILFGSLTLDITTISFIYYNSPSFSTHRFLKNKVHNYNFFGHKHHKDDKEYKKDKEHKKVKEQTQYLLTDSIQDKSSTTSNTSRSYSKEVRGIAGKELVKKSRSSKHKNLLELFD